jgi:soluble lytic murein transglycosylase-like protein
MLRRFGSPLTLGLMLFGSHPAHAGDLYARACATPLPEDVAIGASTGAETIIPDYARELNAVGRLVGVDPALLRAVVIQESNGNPNAVSEAGAVGLTQLTPVAVREYTQEAALLLGRKVHVRRALDNILLGALYYRDALHRTHGNVEAAARLYHGGPNRAMHGPRTVAYGKAVAGCYRRMTSASLRRAA